MTTKAINMQDFNVAKVQLRDSNLVEASAGTGKTYSISVLVLRLILESNVPIQEILMVTYTKSAVAELEHRVRGFLRQVYAIVCQDQTQLSNPSIQALIDQAIASVGEAEVKKRLNNALLFLDETAIMTIHGFCQKTLNEFAFETDQMFNAGTITPIEFESVKSDAVNTFWRSHMNAIGHLTLSRLNKLNCNRAQLLSLLSSRLNGQTYLHTAQEPVFDPQLIDNLEAQIQTFETDFKANCKLAQAYLNANVQDLITRIQNHRNAKNKDLIKYIQHAKALYKLLYYEKNTPNYVFDIFSGVLEWFEPLRHQEEQIDQSLTAFKYNVQSKALDEVFLMVQSRLSQLGVITFDDMISKLHHAVVSKDNKSLHQSLRQKYKAVLIDEFQDTDKLQFELFNTLFNKHSILFYIGDPKQSIYAWRKADINTYFMARHLVRHVYTMNTNYRSSASVIDGLNHFFLPEENFDTFAFDQSADAIKYWHVKANNTLKSSVRADWYQQKPILYTACKDKQTVMNSCLHHLKLLLESNTELYIKDQWRPVKTSDICILVRSNNEAAEIQKLLRRYAFPSVTVDDAKLSDSPEAKAIYYLLFAVFNINRSNVNRALLNPWMGFDEVKLLQINESLLLERFKYYQTLWDKEGVFVLLMQVFSDFEVKARCMDASFPEGNRVLSNLLQFTELLHKHQLNQHFQALDLLNWLQKLLEDKKRSGDEFEMRMESDDAAITIMTIHKSKGLEFPVVFAPTLNLTPFSSNIINFRDPESAQYYFGEAALLSPEQLVVFNTQIEQEHRRLIYVALTRTAHLCYLYNNLHKKTSSLAPFMPSMEQNPSVECLAPEEVSLPKGYAYKPRHSSQGSVNRIPNHFELQDSAWRKWSYSSIVSEHEPMPVLAALPSSDAYEDWVLRQLPKGATTGNMLHLLFERMVFNAPNQWSRLIEQSVKGLAEYKRASYATHLQSMMEHICNVPFKHNETTFTLSELSSQYTLNELEFDFQIQEGSGKAIKSLSTEAVVLDVKYNEQLIGMLNGKMDMLFQMHGKYFILDWKSNYLGPQVADYAPDQLNHAMNHNHYHLQYHLYSIAAVKYLKSRLQNFDYDQDFGGVYYVFVRGVRADQTTGIFYAKPSLNKLKQLAAAVGATFDF